MFIYKEAEIQFFNTSENQAKNENTDQDISIRLKGDNILVS